MFEKNDLLAERDSMGQEGGNGVSLHHQHLPAPFLKLVPSSVD